MRLGSDIVSLLVQMSGGTSLRWLMQLPLVEIGKVGTIAVRNEGLESRLYVRVHFPLVFANHL